MYIVYTKKEQTMTDCETSFAGHPNVTVVSSRSARSNWRNLLDQIMVGSQDIVIERNGEPVAVMIPVADYEDLQEELEELRSARRAAALYEAWKQDSSLARPIEDIEKELNAAGLLHGGEPEDLED